MSEYIYCIGEGSYSDREVIAAFHTKAERDEWLTKQVRLPVIADCLVVKHFDPNRKAEPRPGSFSTSAPSQVQTNRKPFWFVQWNGAAYISGISQEFDSQEEAEDWRREILAGQVIPLTEFLRYWTQDVPVWDVNSVDTDEDDE